MSDNKTLNPVERAAILMMSLGEADAAEVLKHMGPKEVQRIGTAMAELANVQQDQVEVVMSDFLNTVGNQTGLGVGSDDYIRTVLTQALGADKAGSLIDRILEGGNTRGLDTLKWMEARQVADVIRYEHPQIQAIVVSYLDPDQAAQVMTYFEDKVRIDILMRISALESVQPAALKELNDILERQFTGAGSTKTTDMGGVKVVADIMNFLDTSTEATVMEAIREVDEDLSDEIQDLMFVFANLADVDDRAIQTIMREISTDILVVALKGADTALQEKIFKNMSKRAAELLRDDLEASPPVKLSDVENAQKEILTVARRLADEGEIMLGGGGEEMI
ncbi:flagellar motor switch protein FliG [Motiliproteus coralliicola]|uniref:Flagellar motor switch protein FliG n=1 Tax=Motiliproteus coralliicola TaxID=2283196 RepID=A0A369WMH8_9GAMM|nr:flagellar motor switch protein FliG [Motiliproteus coralliicola]RDE22413.1 flagellar motor switch protein FliG [Motiliproteus coralliicola]